MDKNENKPGSCRPADAFPSTAYTLLGQLLRSGGTAELQQARHHVMCIYQRPLAIYLNGSSFAERLKQLKEMGPLHNVAAEDIVQGFFADRIARDGFLADWLRSERPLRYWLITAFKHHLYELVERLERQARDRRPERGRRPAKRDAENDPVGSYNRELALELVREAVRQTIDSLAVEERIDAWQIVMRHHVEGRGYRDLAIELGVSASQAKVMTMRAAQRFRTTLERLAGWPGASPEQVQQEILELMEAIQA